MFLFYVLCFVQLSTPVKDILLKIKLISKFRFEMQISEVQFEDQILISSHIMHNNKIILPI